jgi:hypothetical protein
MQGLHRQILLVLAAAFAGAAASAAADHAAVAPYLADDVSSVVYLDLEKLSLLAIGEELEKLQLIAEPHLKNVKEEAAAIQAKYDQLTKLGARRAYLLVRASDIFQGGPTLIVEVAEEQQAQAVADWLMPLGEKLSSLGDVADYLPKEFAADGAVVIGATSQDRIKKIRAERNDSPRQEAVDALAAPGGDGDAGFVAFGDVDSRRVVREMFPQLPAPFMEIDGKLLADGLKWIGVRFTLPPAPTITLSAETTGGDVAATLKQSVEKATVLAKAFLMKEAVSGPPAHQARAKGLLPLLPLLGAKVNGSRVTLTFGDDEQEIAFVRNLLPAITQQLRTEAYRNSRMNQFKQILLGMNNHESARGAFPTAASYHVEGRPLLSWRVQILPYMDQIALWKKFRLDEPWDSEHNRKLIDEMPDIYADPDPVVRATIGDGGRTTFVVPTGDGLIFGGREALKYKDITDGTSNTIMVVEIVPERAVVWTKPDDWEVDLKDPLAGVKRSDRDWFTTGWCDAHAKLLSNSIDADVFRAVLTPAGGEVVDHADIK